MIAKIIIFLQKYIFWKELAIINHQFGLKIGSERFFFSFNYAVSAVFQPECRIIILPIWEKILTGLIREVVSR